MKVLFVSTRSHDLMSIFLYEGFCELVGQESVVLADCYPYFANTDGGGGRIVARLGALRLLEDGDSGFDLAVVNACFYRDHDWNWLRVLLRDRLGPKGVVAYVEGWDSTHEQFPPPPGIPVHRVFRREIQPGQVYPYHPTPLTWASPSWWFDEPRPDKNYDVTCMCSVAAVRERWPIMSKIYQCQTRCQTLVGQLPFDQYIEITHRSKYVVVPPGGGSDCVRQWEAIAAGAVPIFVGHPPRVREPWFTDEILCCGIDELPGLLDHVLSHVNWKTLQERLEAKARAEHTTKHRAQRVVELTGVV